MSTSVPRGRSEQSDLCGMARAAAEHGDWQEAHELFCAVGVDAKWSADDLELWSTAGYLIGRVDIAVEAMARAHDEHLERGDATAAVRAGFWVIFMFLGRGDLAQASGWVARCVHEVDEVLGEDDVARGYLALYEAQRLVAVENRYDDGVERAEQAIGLSRVGGDSDLLALALMVAGRARIRGGQTATGFVMLDEAMVGVVRDEVAPIVAGTLFCAVIEACGEVGEFGRAVEWTEALTTWCDSQRGMVTFTGQCRTHRAAVLMLRGHWDAAVAQAEEASIRFAGAADEPAMGETFYLLAELHRVAGREALAEQTFRQAAEWGRDPQPGLALLRLAQGRAEEAAATVHRMLQERDVPIDRLLVLPAAVQVLLEVGDTEAAAAASDELTRLGESFDTPGLLGAASHAAGAVLLGRDLPVEALRRLRDAAGIWRSVGAVYELARTRVLIARACRNLSDDDSADLELAAARGTFTQLAAAADLRSLPADASDRYGLSPRELEVLRLVTRGLTNRAVAAEMNLSVRTVDRHVAHILEKLGVSSRTAASSFAHKHRLI